MSFYVAKLGWLLTTPSNFLLLLGLLGLLMALLRRSRIGLWLVTAALAAMLLATILPLGLWLAAPLEDRFPAPSLPDRIDGVVVLGGGVDQIVTAARGQTALTDAAERYTVLLELARRYPEARLLFTGGIGNLLGAPETEADSLRRFFRAQGVADGRITFEDQSRNTRENALFSERIAAPRPDERWLLVTSAMHMPRAMGVFQAIGWRVEPFPVDYRSEGAWAWRTGLSVASRLDDLDRAVREWQGLVYYRLLGWTTALFPGPG